MIVRWLKEFNRRRLAKRQTRKLAPHANPAPVPPVLPFDATGRIDPTTLHWNNSPAAQLSIIVRARRDPQGAMRSIRAWLAAAPALPWELLVLADADMAPSYQVLGERGRLVLHAGGEGAGWQAAVARTQGDGLLLLDEDACLLPGAVEALLETAGARPGVGIVALKAMTFDGALLHAGGMVDQEGQLGFFGQLQHPGRPEFNYTRECDFAPPPALFVRRECWASTGEVVERYANPAYAAAALALEAVAKGYQVIYEPRAAVICAKQEMQGRADDVALQAERARFAGEYAAMLRSRFALSMDQPLTRRDHLARGPVLLVVDHYVPEPDMDAGSRNIVEFLRTFLAMGYLVKFWPKDLDPAEPYTTQLQSLGIEVIHGPFVYSFLDWIKTHGTSLDIALLSRPTVAPDVIPALRVHTRAKLVYYGHDLHFERMQREARVKQDRRIAKAAVRMRRTESEIWKAVDMVLYPSQEEIDTVKSIAPRANAHFVPPFQFDAFEERSCATSGLGILFVAGFQHAPNVDAACWFVEHVLPLVLAQHPQARLTLAGSNPTPEVLALRQVPCVEVTGKLSAEQLSARYRQARVAAVPLRFGAGVKLKVVEAMQQGVPLVTTRTGLQGLPGVMSVVPPTDDARAMAQRISDLLGDDAAWLDSSQAQSLYVAQHFSTSAMRRRFETLFGSLSQ